MASSGTAAPTLRHSFMTHAPNDRDPRAKKLVRTPSLPSQFNGNATNANPNVKQKKRPSGLFESSSESDSEEDGSYEPSPTERDAPSTTDRRLKFQGIPTGNAVTPTATATRHHQSLGGMDSSGRDNSVNNERKGLFEIDDDTGDSVETLRERVKLRQKKKENEVLGLKSELQAALVRVRELERELQNERKEKDEFAIRMNECQRLIEKRTKQLIKANEKLARLAEQSESRIVELQQKGDELMLQVETTRTQERTLRERQRVEYEDKLTQQRHLFEAERERTTLDFADKMSKKDGEEAALRRRVVQLEQEVASAASRIGESAEYQILLKRCEDAEAISRGLRFQLEKTQNEKAFLKKQVLGASTSGDASSSADHFANLASTTMSRAPHSPTSSVASEGLSSFDFFPPQVTPPLSPVATASTPPPPPLSASLSRNPSLNILTGSHVRRDVQTDASSRAETSRKDSGADSRESVYRSTDDGDSPPQAPSQTEKTEGKTRPGSGSINFFEKISIKFKRSASSPRNSSAPAGARADFADNKPSSIGSFPTSSQPQSPPAAASHIDTPSNAPTTNRKQGLPSRPKMYVAKSPSNHEESSDSMFGSDSDSDVSSDEEDRSDEPPPPPPPRRSRSPPSRSVDVPSAPPPPPPLFGDDASDDDSSLSDFEIGATREDELRRVILPTPQSPSLATAESTAVPTVAKPKPKLNPAPPTPFSSSSDESDSERSDSDTSDGKKTKRTEAARQPRAKPTQAAVQVEPSSSSSDSEEELRTDDRRRRSSRKNTETDATTPPRKNDRHERERTRSTDGEAAAAAAAKVNRMNEYMEARARKRNEKLKKKQEHESAEHKKREEYEKEWERMAQEERERRRKQQKTRRTGKRRPSSMKTVRVSQMRQQMGKHHQKDAQGGAGDGLAGVPDDSEDDAGPPHPERQRSDFPSSDSDRSDDDGIGGQQPVVVPAASPPLPPEPTAADTELYIRQQARLRERHEMEVKKKQDADEADQVRGQIHRRVEMWAFGKELLHMILTLDQISTSDALRQCQLSVVQSPDPETLRKAYRNIIRVIHPDKLRGATISEQLEAQELFTVLNQAFEKFKAQNS